jgi:hypothetical protein
MVSVIITEKQMELIVKQTEFQENLRVAEENWAKLSNQEKQYVLEICKVLYPKNNKLMKESKWYNTVGDIVGIVDPTGVVDLVNGISYFSQGDHLFGLLSLIAAIPIIGKVTAKPVIGALKIGGAATKGLKSAMNLAKVGKTAEASVALAKLAEKPGVIGKFLQSAKNWAPKVASKVEMMPGGVLKGFRNTILDYLKLLENAGAKSLKFQKSAGILAKNLKNVAKPVESIGALKNMLKNEKVFTGLTKKGPLSKIFIGGAPRLFGNREMRILMRRTKWWLGFLDYIGVGNFVGPDELAKKMGEANVIEKMNQYNQTEEAKKNAEYDFGNQNYEESRTSYSNQQGTQQGGSPQKDPIQGFMADIFGGQMKNSLFAL